MKLRQDKDDKQSSRPGNAFFRPVSIMVLAAIVVVLFMGPTYVFVRHNPERFAGFLMMNFLFFFVAAVLAIDDIVRIITASVKRRREIYLDTLGDKEFYDQLREEVRRNLPPE